MSEFMDEAKKHAVEPPDNANKGLDDADQFADNKTGGRFDSQIQGAEQQAEGYLGTDQQGQQGQQDPQGQQN